MSNFTNVLEMLLKRNTNISIHVQYNYKTLITHYTLTAETPKQVEDYMS